MAVSKTTRKRPIPLGSRIDRKAGLAIWHEPAPTGRPRKRTAPLHPAGDGIVVESNRYSITFRDHEGRPQRLVAYGWRTGTGRFRRPCTCSWSTVAGRC